MATGRWLSTLPGLAASSPVAIVLLVLANLVPLVGVLSFGWDVGTVLISYWIESGIIGALNVVRILLAEGADAKGHPTSAAKVGLAGFFIVHYGLFWLVHGMFVMVLVVRPAFFDFELTAPLQYVLSEPGLALAALALLLSHGASLLFNYIGRGEYLTTSPGVQMFAPYSRVFVLHLTVIFGGIFVTSLGQPEALVILLVLFKTAADLGFHLVERGRYQRRALGTQS
jgi:hypothetical protein